MITRGYFLGEIIDELSNISNEVETRCKLGLTDLNRFLEDFFKDILNILLNSSLRNLNEDRSNFPGIDLGDEKAKIAFQVTSEKSSAKVNDTLKRVSQLSDNPYTKIVVLIIRARQSSYTLDSDLCAALHFSEENIWDITTLCRKALDLPLDRIQALYEQIKREVVRIKIELEIPTSDGRYATSIDNYVEPKPTVRMGALEVYKAFINSDRPSSDQLTDGDVAKDFSELTTRLARLPRITREFYSFLLERRDEETKSSAHGEFLTFNYDRLTRQCRYDDLTGELRLLDEQRLATFSEPDDYGGSPYVRISIPGENPYFISELVDFIDRKLGRAYRDALVELNFSAF